MSITSDIASKVEEHLNDKLVSSNSVSGGCIADSRIIKTESGKSYFLKTHSGSLDMFLKEANGLKELKKADAVNIPEVILADNSFLLLENIKSGKKSATFFEDFGAAFARMHKYCGKTYGFYEDNYIGATPQINISSDSEAGNWPEFYFNKRILAQLKFAESNGYATPELIKGVSQLEGSINSILDGSLEPPTLLHGDLWGGNYMCNSEGNAVLIDPAVYYGHREADLAMTKMFGGFTSDFYRSYNEEYPLKEGWQYREGLYLLYHYMNHLNLFGRGYYGECERLLKKYTS